MESIARHAEGRVSPREWVGLLGGRDLAPIRPRPSAPVDVALFRFGDLLDRSMLPPLDAHYVSFTIRGVLLIERQLGAVAERARFRPGMSLILPADRPNTWRWDGATDELHLYLSPTWLAGVAARDRRTRATPIERFAFEDPLLRALAQALLDERRSGGVGGSLYDDALAETIALRLLRAHCSTDALGPAPAALAPAALRRVRDLVEDELDRDLSLDDLARVAGLSRSHFARAFRAAVGEAPYGYLRSRRVERARRLLATTDLPAFEIAVRTGFSSASHLGRVFRAATGFTPGAYRRQLRA